jgi:hypothetical protein
VVDSIEDLKAPGVDGFQAIIYMQFWQLVGKRIKEEVLSVHYYRIVTQHYVKKVISTTLLTPMILCFLGTIMCIFFCWGSRT